MMTKGWRYNGGGGGALPQGVSQLYAYIIYICIHEHTYTTYTHTHADYDAAPGRNYGNSDIYIYYIHTHLLYECNSEGCKPIISVGN